MAEVATSVLHNVGNVLNSVNTSASVIADRLKKSKGPGITKLSALLEGHRENLAEFLTQEGRAEQVIRYLNSLATHLSEERSDLVREVKELSGNIEHIKEIVVMQQSYARVAGVAESVNPVDLVEDSLRMNSGALNRHGVEIVKDFADVPPITVEKHKVLQILVNLIRNAKHACDDSPQPNKRMRLKVQNGGDRVRISVEDNGVGIPPENMARIFNLGFTTRKEGHGFGLHSGAIAAREMGGALLVHSDGHGRGARFTLELPVRGEDSPRNSSIEPHSLRDNLVLHRQHETVQAIRGEGDE
jgi:signal transduction histidine kinase